MRHVVILAHPAADSFNAAAARAYADAASDLGETAEIRDLYRIGFDPRLPAHELPWRKDFAPSQDVLVERRALADADVIVFVYPLWFNAPPAMLKGYLERVLSFGFGYGPDAGGTRPLLTSKRLITISTSGAPDAWVDQTGAVTRLREGFDAHIAATCGLTVVEHLHLGGVTPGLRDDVVRELLEEVAAMARRLFAQVG